MKVSPVTEVKASLVLGQRLRRRIFNGGELPDVHRIFVCEKLLGDFFRQVCVVAHAELNSTLTMLCQALLVAPRGEDPKKTDKPKPPETVL